MESVMHTREPVPGGDGGHERAALAQAGMRAFFRIMALWGVNSWQQQQVLLGGPGRSTLFHWKDGHVARLNHDTLERLSYIIGIFKGLQVLYQDPQLADGWVGRPNVAFNGQSALQRMLAGNVTDLAEVRRVVDAARDGWG